jgi:hypothetical protein
MPRTPQRAQQWAGLTRDDLRPRLGSAVRYQSQDPEFWAAVGDIMRDDQALAGHVRGLLRELAAEHRDDTDAAIWAVPIARVRRLLTPATSSDAIPATAPPPADPPPAGGSRAARPARLPTSATARTPAAAVPTVEFRAAVPPANIPASPAGRSR